MLNAEVCEYFWNKEESLSDDLLAIARANSATLRELCLGVPLAAGTLEQLLRAAPRLTTLRVCLEERENVASAAHVLRGEPPFDAPVLHLRECCFWVRGDADVLALAAALAAAGPSFDELLLDAHSPGDASEIGAGAFETLVGALIARRVEALSCSGGLGAACAPVLARLLRDSTALTYLHVGLCQTLFDNADGVAAIAAALRRNCTLTSLSIVDSHLCDADAVGAVLLAALVAHHSVEEVRFSSPHTVVVEGAPAVLIANTVHALVAANAPALRQLLFFLDASPVLHGLIDEAMADALPRNTHLKRVRCAYGNHRWV